MTVDDHRRCGFDPLDVDEERLDLAKTNLAKVDVLGIHERYDEFMDEVERRFGWRRYPIPNWHVSEPSDVPAALQERIRADNALDLDLYEYAVELCNARRRA